MNKIEDCIDNFLEEWAFAWGADDYDDAKIIFKQALFKAIVEDERWPKKVDYYGIVGDCESALAEILGVENVS